jgi:N-acylneuraminate cytidylyltransferase
MANYYKSIGFIPLQKNSEKIPYINTKKFLGRPLFAWVFSEAIFSELDHVFIFTDDEAIIDYVKRNYQWTEKVSCIKRSEKNTFDTSSTEDAVMEFTDGAEIEFEVFCLLRASSPLTRREDINAALRACGEKGTDSALSVVHTKGFTWSKEGKSLNYDYLKRPPRKDLDGVLTENGAIYCTRRESLKHSRNRLSGKIVPFEMPEDSLLGIDSEKDWMLAEQLTVSRLRHGRLPARIDYLVLDVDGVFSDGKVMYNSEGEFSKTFDMRDGMGLEIIREQGVKLMVITSEDSTVVRQRMQKLKIDDTFLGVKDKFSFLERICLDRGIKFESLAYIGDDVNDLANLLRAGWAFCPSNATNTVKYYADVILNHKAADGAIREATEFIINYNRRFDDL